MKKKKTKKTPEFNCVSEKCERYVMIVPYSVPPLLLIHVYYVFSLVWFGVVVGVLCSVCILMH